MSYKKGRVFPNKFILDTVITLLNTNNTKSIVQKGHLIYATVSLQKISRICNARSEGSF